VSANRPKSIRLSDAHVGQWVRIERFDEGGDALRRHLAELGIRVGEVVEIKSKAFLGPIGIATHETDLALCRGQAEKIFVRPI